jgi:hypothetical protein
MVSLSCTTSDSNSTCGCIGMEGLLWCDVVVAMLIGNVVDAKCVEGVWMGLDMRIRDDGGEGQRLETHCWSLRKDV